MIHAAANAVRLSRRDRRQAIRALGWLTVATAAIRVWPYSALRGAIDRIAPRTTVGAPITPVECEQALRRAVRVLPGASCLARAIAAVCLLRRDGRNSTLILGVRFDSSRRFQAHAWLECDGIVVTGRNELFGHRVLLRDVIDRNSFSLRHV
jgi:hypothetical protein